MPIKRYTTKSVFLVKFDGRVERIYGSAAAAEAFLARCREVKDAIIDEWPVEFESEIE
jgi:hypothetical protein